MGLRKLKLKNPYLVAYIAIGVFFLLWMVFLDTHSLLVHQELNKEIENFWQTENLYTAILYEKRPEENYFKIKAIAKNNSSNIVN